MILEQRDQQARNPFVFLLTMPESPLVEFYLGRGGAGSAGYSLKEIQEDWSDQQLELIHNYIQWLFPLTEFSAFNPSAPILDSAAIIQFRSDSVIQENLSCSFKRMLAFYGFETHRQDNMLTVLRSEQYARQSINWLTQNNHNFLRITRILKSLRLLGKNEEAQAFLMALKAVYAEEKNTIGRTTLHYWTRAVS